MPLQSLQLRPGVNRESTSLANEGTWFEMDKVRFRSGYPEKLGGWVKDTGSAYDPSGTIATPPAGSFWGVCRSLRNWVTLAGFNLLSLGTNLKLYIQQTVGGNFYDVTPLRLTVTITGTAFTTTSGSGVVVCNVPGHGSQTGDFVTISGVVGSVNGITDAQLNREFQITYIDNNSFSISTTGTASPGVSPAGTATFALQINTGSDIYTTGVGWGAGGWGGVTGSSTPTGWGSAAPAGVGVGVQLRLWSQANFGDRLVANPRGGPIYLWVPAASPATYYRAQVLSSTNTSTQDGQQYWLTDSSCPVVANSIVVSDASRFLIAFGCNNYGETTLDPMLVRWSDAEDYRIWFPDEDNRAGFARLSSGSSIIGQLQSRQEILIWTDSALYSMQFVGGDLVWQFQILGDNLSIMGPNTAALASGVAYWMGLDKFYAYSGRVETLYCPLRQYIFGDINLDQSAQFFASTNEGFNEVWWFYCSANSTVIDRYVVYNHLEKLWSYGNLSRTSWLDSPLRDYPIAAGYNGQLFYHEQGVDDGSTNPPSPISCYIQSADFDIGDGHNYGFVWRMIPDITFDGSYVNNPEVTFTLRPRQNPGSNYGMADTPAVISAQNYQGQRNYTVQQFTEIIYTRLRGRQMAFRVSSDGLGVQWQLGVPRMDVRPDGRR
jgi:hypothetical protein